MWGFLAVVLTACMLTGDALLVKDIKLADVVNISSVPKTQGYHIKTKAYDFLETDKTSDLVASENVSALFVKEVDLIKQFTVKAYFLATTLRGGTIVFFSPGPKKGGLFSIVVKWSSNTALQIETDFRVSGNGASYACGFKNLNGVSRNEWLFLQVRVYMRERLLRCEIKTKDGTSYFRHTGRTSDELMFDRFSPDGRLRLAQQVQAGSEDLEGIIERFVGKLQDVTISFGDPNCTITIDDTYAPPTTAAPVASTTKEVKDETCRDSEGKKRQDGEKWMEGNWVKCNCNKRRTYCIKSAKRCLQGGKQYNEGDVWNTYPDCDRCKCVDGVSVCEGTDRIEQVGCEKTCSSNKACQAKAKGCFCPGNKVVLDGKCEAPAACPCFDQGKEYKVGLQKIGCDWWLCSSGIMKHLARVC